MNRIRVIDSHTEGEPTRVVIAGGPQLIGGSMVEFASLLRDRYDTFRTTVVCEPRGHDAIVGALLTPPTNEGSIAGVIYFNNDGVLGMCGHGTIGVVRTLQHLGKITAGTVRLDTPVGTVTATLHEDDTVTIQNVPSFRFRHNVEVDVPGYGLIHGDVAYGGNWFFLAKTPGIPVDMAHLKQLSDCTVAIRHALEANAITGDQGALIDHIELFGEPGLPDSHSRNYVLCPGLAYDRSPCGTGTSAKLACLAADGTLPPNTPWLQESVIGSRFKGSYEWANEAQTAVLPSITGSAFITAEADLIIDPLDPFANGIVQ